MRVPNHRGRRNRTFRVEVLESRALLNIAGVVSRPAAAIAPLARFAQFSSVAGDPTFKGTMRGKFQFTGPNAIKFKTKGTMEPAPFAKAMSTFSGTATAVPVVNADGSLGGYLYTNGNATLTSFNGMNRIHVNFKGFEGPTRKLELEGFVLLGEGRVGTGGTFSASGTVKIHERHVTMKVTFLDVPLRSG
jgi:hypothetical protein